MSFLIIPRRLFPSRLLALTLVSLAGTGCVAGASDAVVDDARTEFSPTDPESASASEVGLAPSEVGLAPAGSGEGLALSVHTTLGIPEPAAVGDARHYLLLKREYVTSFDSVRKNPRWTSWELSPSWIGSAPRSSSFKRDASLPILFPQPVNGDFTNSGFTRGHVCPSADRTKSAADNASTFVFTNIVPQVAQSNSGPWESLERTERTLAKGSGHVFIVAGSIYTNNQTVGDGVAVPTSMFKVVVALSGDHPTPADVTTSTRVIAVEIPNTANVSSDLRPYRTSVASLEAKTGFRFLSDVPAPVHDALATHVDAE